MIKLLSHLSLVIPSLLHDNLTPVKNNNNTIALPKHANFPAPRDALEFAILSQIIYSQTNCTDPRLPTHLTCHLYEEKKDGTNVMLASSKSQNYIAIIYEGTNNVKNWAHDLNISLMLLGPANDPLITTNTTTAPGPQVHAGFNEAVFNEGLFDELFSRVKLLSENDSSLTKVIVSGHSLGAANAIITGVAMAFLDPSLNVEVYNYGCPKTGDAAWKKFVDSSCNALGRDGNLAVWRFVYEEDIVPRVPLEDDKFKHVGHTVQLESVGGAGAYYFHYGDQNLRLRGVPRNWESEALLSTDSVSSHNIDNYISYMKKSVNDPQRYFANSFLPTKKVNSDIKVLGMMS